nr:type VI secretion system PAAR protein [Aeromonas sp.]
MSKQAAKVGDIGTDHDGFHPTVIIAGSPDVFIDGIPAARVGDPLAPHDKPNNPPHPRSIASGSSTVLINGKPAALTGGAVATLVTMSLVVATLPVSGILATGALFAFGSFFMGRELDALDERYGFSDEIGNSLKRLVE